MSSFPAPSDPLAAGSVAATLRALSRGARASDVWRTAASALLRLSARERDAVALVFEDESVNDEQRLLALDLLAGAGTFEAQIVMRRLLALAVARRESRMYATFVQRLGFVECPDGPTLRFLMSVYAESRAEPHDVRASCAYALGAASGHAHASGEPEASIRASDVLRRDLLAAQGTPEKCALLTALGNAGIPTDVMVMSRFTQDFESPVRAAAALALRKMLAPEATLTLLAMLADRDPKVADCALRSLSEHTLDDEQVERLAELVLAERTPRGLDAAILRFLVAQRPRLTSCPGRAGAIETALRLLLSRVEIATDPMSIAAHASGERRMTLASAGSAFASAVPPPPRPGSYRMVTRG